jgi:glycosyltransferase involved in cell wall biosynthesis
MSGAPASTEPDARIAVILPAYNEELTVASTIEAFHAALPSAAIHVVDNNSRDRTGELAAAAIRRIGCGGSVIHERRQGKGNAVRRAFLEVEADVYLICDADMTYRAERAPDLVRPVLENRADMVVGDRHSSGHYATQNQRPLHGFGNTLVRWLVNRLFRARLVDIMSGYRAFNRRFVKSYPIIVEGFEIETDMTLHALHKRFRILEIPVEYGNRPAGSASKLSTLYDGFKVVFAIVQILRYYRPLLFFGALAFLFMLAGFATGVPVLDDWVTERYIRHVPLAILASALEIIAVLTFGIGLVLDSISHQERMNYERHLLSRGPGSGDDSRP